MKDTVEIRWSFDEHINDGFYCASSLALAKEVVEDPESVLGPPVDAARGGARAAAS